MQRCVLLQCPFWDFGALWAARGVPLGAFRVPWGAFWGAFGVPVGSLWGLRHTHKILEYESTRFTILVLFEHKTRASCVVITHKNHESCTIITQES